MCHVLQKTQHVLRKTQHVLRRMRQVPVACFGRCATCCGRLAKKFVWLIAASTVFLLCVQIIVFLSFSPEDEDVLYTLRPLHLPRRRNKPSDTFLVHSRYTGDIPRSDLIKFVVVLSQGLSQSQQRLGLHFFEKTDLKSIQYLKKILETTPGLDGASCLSYSLQELFSEKPDSSQMQAGEGETKRRLESAVSKSWCRFKRRGWSLIIRNTGPIESISVRNVPGSDLIEHAVAAQRCNIVEGPFLMKKEKFLQLKGWRSNFGRAAVLDFFLRSKGKLNIAKVTGCFMSEQLYIADRGMNEGLGDFPDYAELGLVHGVLRIIQENRVEWTVCAAHGELCKEQPYTPSQDFPVVAMPICCSSMLGIMLRDIVKGLNAIGLEYRVVFGTLLGAVRSGAIIPWTHDLDLAIRKRDYDNKTIFVALQRHFGGRYYIRFHAHMRRAIALYPPYATFNRSLFYGPEDLEGEKFFSADVMGAVRKLKLDTDWRARGYMDFNLGPEVWWKNASKVTINGREYVTVKDAETELRDWYGESWRQPVHPGNTWRGLSDKGAA
ncbi:predicted protein [Nematostella vectensis]|uniref:LicD/FKTN/FKRP nucleotidyltransferase domain-containing protein n=1 Tax=Nematostella vectensis TaxID=45351 RepID=A7RTD6_NEMVE|nr:predicted protein [Nematostella vectensis]|eukprot:XP_001637256.1 predicted protein [Nematostella vectensis]